MMAKNSIEEATRLLLQSSAKAYYCGLSEDAKAAVRQSFSAADTGGKGHISFHDFFDSVGSPTLPGFSWKGLFGFLDADNNGFLELDEFITLYYITKSGVFFCNACGIPIITGGFSCTQCPPPGRDSFDVCLSCYASPMLAFSHHHPQTSFVNLVARYHQSGSKNNSFNSVTPSNNSMAQPQATQIDVSGSMDSKCDCCGAKECASAAEMAEMNAKMATPGQLNQDQQPTNHKPHPTHSFTKLIDHSMDLIAQLINLSIQAGLFNG